MVVIPLVVGETDLPRAVGVDDVDLAVPVLETGERDLFAVGDTAGERSNAGLLVRLVWPEPSGFMA
jgi:hypothetical protein